MAARERQIQSRNKFKSVKNASEARRERSALQDLARKEKRIDQANQRRKLHSATGDDVEGTDAVIKAEEQSLAKGIYLEKHAKILLQKLNGPVFEDQLAATMKIRKMLSVEENPPIDRIIDLGCVPRLLDLLFEAAWALTNIGSGTSTQTDRLVTCGAVPRFRQLLTTAGVREELRDQCVWALGNIVGDGPRLRDLCLSEGAMDALLMQLTDSADLSLIRNTCWSLSNLYRGKPCPPLPLVLPGMPYLSRLLAYPDPETQADAAWAFSYITDGPDEYVTAACAVPGAMEQLVQLLGPQTPSAALRQAALRAVGNVVSGSTEHTQRIVELDPFDQLFRLATGKKKECRKEACWALSNITAGTQHQIHQCIVKGAIPVLVDRLLNDVYVVRREACWALANACQGGTHEQIRLFVTNELIHGLIQMGFTQHANHTVKMIVLEALECILDAGVFGEHPSSCIYLDVFEELDGVSFLDDAALDDNDNVASKACFLLETYFYYDTEDLGDDDAAAGFRADGRPVAVAAGDSDFDALDDPDIMGASAALTDFSGYKF